MHWMLGLGWYPFSIFTQFFIFKCCENSPKFTPIFFLEISLGYHPSWGSNRLCIGEDFNIRTFQIYQRAITFGNLQFLNFRVHFRNVNWIVGFGFVLWLSIAYCFANLNHRISFLVKNMVMVRTCFIGVRYGCVPLFKKAFGANIALITS